MGLLVYSAEQSVRAIETILRLLQVELNNDNGGNELRKRHLVHSVHFAPCFMLQKKSKS